MAKKASSGTKALLASNWTPIQYSTPEQVSQAQANYESVRRQEISGTGIASPDATPWPAQQAAQQQQQQAAAAAAKQTGDAAKQRKQAGVTANVKFSGPVNRGKGLKS